MKLRTLPIFDWQKDGAGYRSYIKGMANIEYIGLIRRSEELDGWSASLSVDAVLVHMSEHPSRDGAMQEAWHALQRAIALREIEESGK